ncbi:hypothetical protein BO82DRAFT_406585 [Aspergillus uvarum CBS 121591]|uniref:Uncharacterized protein n=1 Tax=Aspergillus uvarum CBS 121591 TaxID=1448315 RepID=A0A319BW98_9EURO|nr:hypothetical protein BO82DRAFT_406585 [Aspergillus uvarum CBS 121591]PYH76975.1 hypothetical protein BO82DRAFT_406585 [Aspergillus uvarum CBS 121591]
MSEMKEEPSSPGQIVAQSQTRKINVERTGNISGLRYVTYGYEDHQPRTGMVGGILQLEGRWFGLTVLTPFLEDHHHNGGGGQPFWYSAPHETGFKSAEIYDAREPHALWGRIPPNPETLQPLEQYFSRSENWALVELVNQELAETCVPGPEASWMLLPSMTDREKPVPRWQLMIPDRVLPPSDKPLMVVKPFGRLKKNVRMCYSFKSGGFLAESGAWVIEELHLSVVGIVQGSNPFTIQAIPAWSTFDELKQRFPDLKPPLICCGFPKYSEFLGSGYDTDDVPKKKR